MKQGWEHSLPENTETRFQIFQKVPKATPQGGEGCSIRWVPFEGKCYYFSAVEKTWDESQEDCALYNSHLAVVNNNAEL
ncbi:hypothetical protein JD844_009835, partial [Phrynosoma platyrhinos]